MLPERPEGALPPPLCGPPGFFGTEKGFFRLFKGLQCRQGARVCDAANVPRLLASSAGYYILRS
jgi:hypothetical protein